MIKLRKQRSPETEQGLKEYKSSYIKSLKTFKTPQQVLASLPGYFSGVHTIKSSGDNLENTIQYRSGAANFVSNASASHASPQTIQEDWEKMDVFMAVAGEKSKPLKAQLAEIKNNKKLSKEEKEAQSKPIVDQIKEIYTMPQSFIASVCIEASSTYGPMVSGKPGKGGKLSGKKAAALAVALAGAGACGYFVYQNVLGGNGKTEMELADYAGSTVSNVTISLDGNNAYASGANTSSPEFLNMIQSSEYQKAVGEILKAKQAQADALKAQFEAQIMGKYQEIDRIASHSEFQEKGVEEQIGEIERIVDSHGKPLESLPAFAARARNFYEEKSISEDELNAWADNKYQQIMPSGLKSLYESFGVSIGWKKDQNIAGFAYDMKKYKILVSVNPDVYEESWTYPDRPLPEGTTIEFLKAYKEWTVESPGNSSSASAARLSIKNEEFYQNYLDGVENLQTCDTKMSFFTGAVDPTYANQVQQKMLEIDELQANYITQTQEIQNSANQELANLQATNLGLNSNALGSNAGAEITSSYAPNDKTDLLHAFVDRAVEAATAIKDGAMDAVTTIVDEISRSF